MSLSNNCKSVLKVIIKSTENIIIIISVAVRKLTESEVKVKVIMINATFNNISVIS
jgi:hypothetical protein